jgi:hypothetical protein
MMPSSQVLMSLARALDVSEEYLLGEQGSQCGVVRERTKRVTRSVVAKLTE